MIRILAIANEESHPEGYVTTVEMHQTCEPFRGDRNLTLPLRFFPQRLLEAPCLSRKNDGVLNRVLYKFGIVLDSQFIHNSALMKAYSVTRNVQIICDLLHQPALR